MDFMSGLLDGPPDQEEEVDETFYGIASWSQAFGLLGDFNHPGICWRDNTARHTQSRKFPQIIEDNFWMKVVEEPMRRGVLLNVALTNQEGLVEDVKVGGSLAFSLPPEMVELRILREGSKAVSRTRTLSFQRAIFNLFKDLFRGVPQDRALEKKGLKKAGQYSAALPPNSRQMYTYEQEIKQAGRRPAWMSRELLANLKTEERNLWDVEKETIWEDYMEYRQGTQGCDEESQGPLELSLSGDIKDKKKALCKYVNSKRKIKESVGLLLNQMGVLVMEDTEKDVFVFRHELALLRISAFMGLIILGGISRLFYTQLMGIFTDTTGIEKMSNCCEDISRPRKPWQQTFSEVFGTHWKILWFIPFRQRQPLRVPYHFANHV
ncbi:PREDICTED: palmitoyltransferase ZDHHC21 isoform X2 [Lepidothrix coronata]|uniref:Palmitoyltransferase ZDHHC21 isoform X2 n=1 Tax=Lepidothrix coronata TaxID=321398 RepID=A0A6J0I027_9PASS|nr:PREDICTED: palmitoyltransferase ZDHHC21 isoform X2 [Lepidothrix coronata]